MAKQTLKMVSTEPVQPGKKVLITSEEALQAILAGKPSIPLDVAPHFLVHDILNAKGSVLPHPSSFFPVPAMVFAERALGIGIKASVDAGTPLSIMVENVSPEPHVFRCDIVSLDGHSWTRTASHAASTHRGRRQCDGERAPEANGMSPWFVRWPQK